MIYRTPPRPTPPYPQVGPGRAGGEGGAPSSRDPEASLRSPGKRRSPLLLLLRLPPFPSPPRALGLDGLAAGRPAWGGSGFWGADVEALAGGGGHVSSGGEPPGRRQHLDVWLWGGDRARPRKETREVGWGKGKESN